jgi:hypothetical protein
MRRLRPCCRHDSTTLRVRSSERGAGSSRSRSSSSDNTHGRNATCVPRCSSAPHPARMSTSCPRAAMRRARAASDGTRTTRARATPPPRAARSPGSDAGIPAIIRPIPNPLPVPQQPIRTGQQRHADHTARVVAVDHCLEVTTQVRPTHLTGRSLQVVVDRVPIRRQHAQRAGSTPREPRGAGTTPTTGSSRSCGLPK